MSPRARLCGLLLAAGFVPCAGAHADVGRAVAKLDRAARGFAGTFEQALYYVAEAAGLPVIRRVSLAPDGEGADGDSTEISLSGDGRIVAFTSEAPNLVPGDFNFLRDVFVRLLEGGPITRVSVDSAGFDRFFPSQSPALDASGRYVFFDSGGALVAEDTNGAEDVYVHDRETGTTRRLSVSTAGAEGLFSDSSRYPSVSADGRFVAFVTQASLGPGDTNSKVRDVYVRDRDARGDGAFDEPGDVATVRVNLTAEGGQGGASSDNAALSGDGRHVAFDSVFTFAGEDLNGLVDLFARDRALGATVRLSLGADGTPHNAPSGDPAISADGRFVAFTTRAAFVPEDTNGSDDVYVRDRDPDGNGVLDEPGSVAMERVSVASDGAESAFLSFLPEISADGRYVVFASGGVLAPEDGNAATDVYVRDRAAGRTAIASLGYRGAVSGQSGLATAISRDGAWIGFASAARDLVPDDDDFRTDVFVVPNPLYEP